MTTKVGTIKNAILQLELLIKVEEFTKAANFNFKKKAYMSVINILKLYPNDIYSSIEDIESFFKKNGIKNAIYILEKLDYLIFNEYLPEVESALKNDSFSSVIELTSIHGIGYVKAYKLFQENIKSINDINKLTEKELKTHFTNYQIVGIKHYKDLQKKNSPRNYRSIL